MTIKFIRSWLKCAYPGCPNENDRGYLVHYGICVFALCRKCGKKWKGKRVA